MSSEDSSQAGEPQHPAEKGAAEEVSGEVIHVPSAPSHVGKPGDPPVPLATAFVIAGAGAVGSLAVALLFRGRRARASGGRRSRQPHVNQQSAPATAKDAAPAPAVADQKGPTELPSRGPAEAGASADDAGNAEVQQAIPAPEEEAEAGLGLAARGQQGAKEPVAGRESSEPGTPDRSDTPVLQEHLRPSGVPSLPEVPPVRVAVEKAQAGGEATTAVTTGPCSPTETGGTAAISVKSPTGVYVGTIVKEIEENLVKAESPSEKDAESKMDLMSMPAPHDKAPPAKVSARDGLPLSEKPAANAVAAAAAPQEASPAVHEQKRPLGATQSSPVAKEVANAVIDQQVANNASEEGPAMKRNGDSAPNEGRAAADSIAAKPTPVAAIGENGAPSAVKDPAGDDSAERKAGGDLSAECEPSPCAEGTQQQQLDADGEEECVPAVAAAVGKAVIEPTAAQDVAGGGAADNTKKDGVAQDHEADVKEATDAPQEPMKTPPAAPVGQPAKSAAPPAPATSALSPETAAALLRARPRPLGGKKVKPNDLCPCGRYYPQRKYKKCCGKGGM